MDDHKRRFRTGLIGAGIQASRSPFMHMTEARALGMDLTYELFDLDAIPGGAGALARILFDVRDRGYLGVNITYPVKQAVLALLDGYSDDAAALGACNSVVFRDGRSVGHNTDWFGFAENFRRGLPGAALDRVLLLGAGGAASAVAYALLKMDAESVVVYARDHERGAAFVERFNVLAGAARFLLSGDLDRDVAGASGVINCTPVGMKKMPGSLLPPQMLRPDLWINEIVYVPLRTELLRAADAAGCRTLDGGGMAVFQAAEAFRLFTDTVPDTQRMLQQFALAAQSERMAG